MEMNIDIGEAVDVCRDDVFSHKSNKRSVLAWLGRNKIAWGRSALHHGALQLEIFAAKRTGSDKLCGIIPNRCCAQR
jgi:hypothetical protein